MGIYQNVVLPRLVHHSMTNRELLPYRQRVLSAAEGRVLEIGIGSGLNLSLYPAVVREVIGLDSSPRLLAMARHTAGHCRLRGHDRLQMSFWANQLRKRRPCEIRLPP